MYEVVAATADFYHCKILLKFSRVWFGFAYVKDHMGIEFR